MAEIEKRVQEFLQLKYPLKRGLRVYTADMSQGWETNLYRLELEYELENKPQNISQVIRAYPGSGGKEKAEKEYRVMRNLQKKDYPVPEVYLVEPTGEIIDEPFIIMEYVEGKLLAEKMMEKQVEKNTVKEMMSLLVRLHEIHPGSISPEDRPPTTREVVDKYIDFHQSFLSKTGNTALVNLVRWLESRRNDLSEASPSFLHGDYHAYNIIRRLNGRLVVIDWGAARVGDPREDLSWTMLLHSIYGDRDSGAMMLKSYRELSNKTLEDVDFFMVLAVFRRFIDLMGSLYAGSENLGMRPETAQEMRAHKENYLKAYRILNDITGLRLEELFSFLKQL